MIRSTRVIYQQSSDVLKDLSVSLSKFSNNKTEVIDLRSGKFLFIASKLPFNHRYFEISVANIVSANMKIEVWDGNEWVEVVDIIDETSTLSQSGHISSFE